jgi:hypothetical protein
VFQYALEEIGGLTQKQKEYENGKKGIGVSIWHGTNLFVLAAPIDGL